MHSVLTPDPLAHALPAQSVVHSPCPPMHCCPGGSFGSFSHSSPLCCCPPLVESGTGSGLLYAMLCENWVRKRGSRARTAEQGCMAGVGYREGGMEVECRTTRGQRPWTPPACCPVLCFELEFGSLICVNKYRGFIVFCGCLFFYEKFSSGL